MISSYIEVHQILIGLAVSMMVCTTACAPPISALERKVAVYWKSHCESETNCVIRIAELVDYDWDRMYVFAPHATRSDVLSALKNASYNYEEFSRKIIFTNNGHVVHSEQTEGSMEGLIAGEVVFESLDSMATYHTYSKLESVFQLRLVALDNNRGYFFQLRRIP